MKKNRQMTMNSTYDEQDRSSMDKVTFEAFFHDPAGGMNIQGCQDLVRTI
jgi:hypothetical protein